LKSYPTLAVTVTNLSLLLTWGWSTLHTSVQYKLRTS